MLTCGGTTFTYTANGELRTKTDSTGTTTYTYDAMGSLIAVSLPDGRLIEYVTDGKGRRIGKMVNGVLTKQWLYRDQLKPVAELDGTGNLVAQFIYGSKTYIPDLIIRGGVSYRVVSDQLGSPMLVVNVANSSDIPFQATYAAFGDRALVAGTDDWMPFAFAGGHYDSDTKLVRFGARDYSSAIGRWASKDPIRFDGGLNLYVYSNDDPVNFADFDGKDAITLGGILSGLGQAAAGALAGAITCLIAWSDEPQESATGHVAKQISWTREAECGANTAAIIVVLASCDLYGVHYCPKHPLEEGLEFVPALKVWRNNNE